jgi:cysteine desulfurase / selenocysteine lyase
MMQRTDIAALRDDFPILAQQVNGAPLTYLDSAATTQKPNVVIDAVRDYYRHDNANVHRAAHALSDRATAAFEAARNKLQRFIGAAHAHEVIWTRGTTESINLVACSYAANRLGPGDEILLSVMEHHSNIVPWQLVAQRTGARVVAVDITEEGDIDRADFARKLGPRTRIVALAHVSNALGTINPIQELTAAAHAAGAIVVVDGAQAGAHLPIDVRVLDCDFYALSGHKMFGPTGIGALYGREALLDAMPPWQAGGEMIETVSLAGTTFNRLPFKFEAGTPNIAGAIGLGAAIDYLETIDGAALTTYETNIISEARAGLSEFNDVQIVGIPRAHTAVLSFLIRDSHPHDVGTLLDQQGIAVRTGHHCTMPLMQRLGLPGTVRASFCLYNSARDVERLVRGVAKVRGIL